MRTVLSIAGSDCSGGAGIQADLKTITAFGMYGMTAITALTVQNTMGVSAVREIEEDVLRGQLEAVFSDIRPDAVKVGMLASKQSVMTVAEALERFRPEHVVLDPVMVSTSGRRLMDEDAVCAVIKNLIPYVTVLTPNVPEAQVLLDWLEKRGEIGSRRDMEDAARTIGEALNVSVLLKGGHMAGGADDCLFGGGKICWFPGERLMGKNSHGTGCTLSSTVACGLAAGLSLPQAVGAAKEYLTGAMRADPALGHGNGPLNHCFAMSGFLEVTEFRSGKAQSFAATHS